MINMRINLKKSPQLPISHSKLHASCIPHQYFLAIIIQHDYNAVVYLYIFFVNTVIMSKQRTLAVGRAS